MSRHLVTFEATNPALSSLDNVSFAGRCGSLLIVLSADETEQLTDVRVRAHARICGIAGHELPTYLDVLKASGCVDWDQEAQTFELLALSRRRVLETTSAIFDGTMASPLEKALPDLLEFCLLRPRLADEVSDHLSTVLREEDAAQLVGLVETFGLLGVVQVGEASQKLYYNGHQFGDRAVDVGRALAALSSAERKQLNALLDAVAQRPGTPPEDVRVSEKVKTMALGLGLVESSKVVSRAGSAVFLTTPRFALPSVGSEVGGLEVDVFDHAKMLLSSLRFGELRSSPGRGRIIYPQVLVKALLDRDRVGPCTAIGEDYVLLEAEGLIRTTPAKDRVGDQFYMELRRREPAEVVLALLRSGTAGELDARSLPRSLQLPLAYEGPDFSRPAAARKAVAQDAETVRRFLEELRT